MLPVSCYKFEPVVSTVTEYLSVIESMSLVEWRTRHGSFFFGFFSIVALELHYFPYPIQASVCLLIVLVLETPHWCWANSVSLRNSHPAWQILKSVHQMRSRVKWGVLPCAVLIPPHLRIRSSSVNKTHMTWESLRPCRQCAVAWVIHAYLTGHWIQSPAPHKLGCTVVRDANSL